MDYGSEGASSEDPAIRVRRHPERGGYDEALVHAILDEALYCHVGVMTERGPLVLPTIHARAGHVLYVHGALGSQLLRAMGQPTPCCLTVTLVDGLVLARSAFNHSLNYRSVVVRGLATMVDDPDEKLVALESLTEHVAPGRWRDARPPSAVELRTTRVVRIPLETASAKVRTGPVIDDAEDMGWPAWAGILPLAMVAGTPEPDAALAPRLPIPDYVAHYHRGAAGSG